MLLLVYFSVVLSLAVYDDLALPPLPEFLRWQLINFTDDHSNRQPNQPSWEWTNVTIEIPYKSSKIKYKHTPICQVTACLTCLPILNTQEIPYYSVDEYNEIIVLSVVWWGKPWVMQLGWNFN